MMTHPRRDELTFSGVAGRFTTLMSRKRQVDFEAFLADHPVFALRELAVARGASESETAARNQLKHHLRSGRVRQVARGIYAAVPPGLDPETFRPDRYLVAAAAKPDGVFAYHAALELQGVAQSVWQECALHCERPRTAIAVGGVEVVFLPVPEPLRREGAQALGVRTIVHGSGVSTSPAQSGPLRRASGNRTASAACPSCSTRPPDSRCSTSRCWRGSSRPTTSGRFGPR